MKKYLYSFVFATLILMSTTVVKASNEVYYTNKQNIEMTEKEYNNLLGLGFTEKQIERMDQVEFNENKDLEGTVLSESKKYIRTRTIVRNGITLNTNEEITEEEALREKELQLQNPPSKGPSGNYYDGMVMNSVIVLTTKIVGVSNTYMRYKVDNDWLIIPSGRYHDIIGIGIESNKVQLGSSIIFREDWIKSDGTSHYNTVCYPKYTNTGGLAIYELPTGSLQTLEATLYFNVKKQSGVGTITSLYAGGDFAHATSSVNPSDVLNHVSLHYSSGLIITSPYSTTYNGISAAVASFIGTW